MRRTVPRRVVALGALAAVAAAALTGAAAPKKKAVPPKLDETVMDVAEVWSQGEIRVEGVGLVIGLDDTGSDPPPSFERQKLLDEMRKANVPDAAKILAHPSTSLVLVKLTIPAGVSPKDRLDVEVEVPATSTTKSLAGGQLMEVRLTQVLIAGDGAHAGNTLALAGGPVLVGDNPRAGRVLGGGHALKEVPFSIILKDGRQSLMTAMLIQKAINTRYHQHKGVDNEGMAEAKRPEVLTLKVPTVYHQNPKRYFQVVKLLPLVGNDDPNLLNQRLAKWGKDLLDPKTSGVAALRLEGVGPNAAEVLKTGLASGDAQIRFFAAESLAYIGEAAGVDQLALTAIETPGFRAQAMAALAALDEPAAAIRLRALMDHPDVRVRYGAFDALRRRDEHDAALGRVQMLATPAEEDEDDLPDLMALATGPSARPRRPRRPPEDPFELYVVDSEGPPMIHVSGTRRCEIVVFGRDQELLTPIVLGDGGSLLLNAALSDRTVQISRIVPRAPGEPDPKVNCPLELGDVIREMAVMGANYPEVAGILQAAARQKNLPGPLVVDAVPVSSPEYEKALLGGLDSKADDAVQKTKLDQTPHRRTLLDRVLRRPAR